MNSEYPLKPGILPTPKRFTFGEGDVQSPKIANLFRQQLKNLDEKLHTPLYWTIRLAALSRQYEQRFARFPGFRETAIGLFDPESEGAGFGVIVICEYDEEHPEFHRKPWVHEPLLIDKLEFPVRLRVVKEELHATGCNPSGGTGGCFGSSQLSSSPVGPGIVTAKHVCPSALNGPVPLHCGCTGHVADRAPTGIDAALIHCPCARRGSKLSPIKLVAPWTPIYFDGATSSVVRGLVTAVTNTMGVFNNPSLPIRVFQSCHGAYGDSGALVRDQASGEPVGLYMGAYTDSAGQTGGFSQHAYQITEIMDMEMTL